MGVYIPESSFIIVCRILKCRKLFTKKTPIYYKSWQKFDISRRSMVNIYKLRANYLTGIGRTFGWFAANKARYLCNCNSYSSLVS